MTDDLFKSSPELDGATIDRVAQLLGAQIAVAVAMCSATLARDDSIPPAEMVAGLCKAHAHGLCSAIAAAGGFGVHLTPLEVTEFMAAAFTNGESGDERQYFSRAAAPAHRAQGTAPRGKEGHRGRHQGCRCRG